MGYQAYSLLKTGCDYSGHCPPIQFHSFSDVQPPIPIYLIAVSNILGVNLDLSIRLVPAIFGTLGIFMTYLFVKNLKSKKIFDLDLPNLEHFSALLIAIVPWHLTYSRIGFALALLYFFVLTGLYFFTEFLIKGKNMYLFLSLLFLGLTPMVYNTAKMAIIFYPLILLLFPNSYRKILQSKNAKFFVLLMFVPVIILFANGSTASRFDYISIFTDPVAGPEVNTQRMQDLGLDPKVGSTTSLPSKIIHNKVIFFSQKFVDNLFGLLSTDFLFTKGDPNLRHSLNKWGMVYRTFLPFLLVGVYFIVKTNNKKLIGFLFSFSLVSLITSAVTRDGFSHASRSFMFLMPIIILCSIGISFINKKYKLLSVLFIAALVIESIYFVHDYWFHYRLESENSWSPGMKEISIKAGSIKNVPVIVSPKNGNPLIFYVYYNRYDPAKFQKMVKEERLYRRLNKDTNLDGDQFGDTNLYIATLVDYSSEKNIGFENAIYYLSNLEYINTKIKTFAKNTDMLKLKSGEPHYYEFKY
jgi:hypothetical protein